MTQKQIIKGAMIGLAVVVISDVVGKYIPQAQAV